MSFSSMHILTDVYLFLFHMATNRFADTSKELSAFACVQGRARLATEARRHQTEERV